MLQQFSVISGSLFIFTLKTFFLLLTFLIVSGIVDLLQVTLSYQEPADAINILHTLKPQGLLDVFKLSHLSYT